MNKAPSTTKSAGPRIGINLGGTKIEAVILNAEGTISTRLRRPTPAGDYDETLEVVDQLGNL
jgi:fructokinase